MIFLMKKNILFPLSALAALPMSAAVVFVDLNDVVIPNDINGIYINIFTGETSFDVDLTSFNQAPWINLYLGGSAIATSELLRPWASQAPGEYNGSLPGNYFLNVAPGTTIDASGSFVTGESASEFHIGAGSDQFQSGTRGYLAFAYESTVGGDTAYGWFSFTPNDSGPGYSVDLAYSNTPGEALAVAAVPEPSSYAALAGVLAVAAAACRRRQD